jgi:hypothetical protein
MRIRIRIRNPDNRTNNDGKWLQQISTRVGTRISCGKAGLAYLGTLGDPLPESSNRGQVQLDEIQTVSSNEVLHQVDTHFHVPVLRPLDYDTIMH